MTSGEFYISFSLGDLLIFILLALGIIALFFLVKVLIGVSKLLKTADEIIRLNKSEIDSVIKTLPSISKNVDNVISNTDKLIEKVTPNVESAMEDFSYISANVLKISDDISDTVELIGMTTADTVDSLQYSVNSFTGYISTIKGIVDTVKNIIKK